MQIPPSPRDDHPAIRPGDLVHVRRARWRVVRIRAYEDCQVVTLCGLTPPHVGCERRVLAPFDRIEPMVRSRQPRIVRAVRWRRACRALIASDAPPGALRAARSARIDLLQYQLEPALALVCGLGTRLLLADEVGLGKTIQAGLILSELLARGAIERALVLTPPALRDQWQQELADRFAVKAAPIDAQMLRALTATLPIGVNPWHTIPVAIASIDYVKRPEVLPAVASCRWDLVVVDEAHACAGDSDRRAAADALAARAPYVLLLSATPHSGDRDAFAALCAIGEAHHSDGPPGAPLLVFRRTRADAGPLSTRRVHNVRIRPSAGEARMHALLTQYSDAICRHVGVGLQADPSRAPWLALSVLHKRALSSAWSLAQSVARRLAALDARDPAAEEQLALPLGDPDGERIATDEAPPWPADLRLSDAALERRLLTELYESARVASRHETKIAALVRLLRRARQPAVVFTEYRDTLLHLRQHLATPALVLHGGLSRDGRASVLSAFTRDPRALLLATDAAAEGLNLHHGCRLVINLELPWNPMRLEQRIGRVDRIGQRRTVHAFHLIAGGTGETRLLARLRTRIATARADIGAPNPLGNDEWRMAALVIAPEAVNDDDGDG